MTEPKPIVAGDLIWGVPAIARYINRTDRTTYYLIAKGFIPIKKLGPRTIVARTSELDRAFSDATNRPIPPRIPPPKNKLPKRRLRRRDRAATRDGSDRP